MMLMSIDEPPWGVSVRSLGHHIISDDSFQPGIDVACSGEPLICDKLYYTKYTTFSRCFQSFSRVDNVSLAVEIRDEGKSHPEMS